MSKKSFFKGAAWGIVLGSIVGLLLAPKAGERSRRQVKGKLKEASRILKKVLSEVEKIKELSKEKYGQIVEKIINEYMKDGVMSKDDYYSLLKDLKGKWKEIYQELKVKPKNKSIKK